MLHCWKSRPQFHTISSGSPHRLLGMYPKKILPRFTQISCLTENVRSQKWKLSDIVLSCCPMAKVTRLLSCLDFHTPKKLWWHHTINISLFLMFLHVVWDNYRLYISICQDQNVTGISIVCIEAAKVGTDSLGGRGVRGPRQGHSSHPAPIGHRTGLGKPCSLSDKLGARWCRLPHHLAFGEKGRTGQRLLLVGA